MATNISLFPVLNTEILEEIKLNKYHETCYYNREGQSFLLDKEQIEANTYKLVDPIGLWTPDDYNIGISMKYTLNNYDCLFGEFGVACNNATIGLALIWKSADSKQRGAVQFGEVRKGLDEINIELKQEFLKAQLRGSVEITILMYIKGTGLPECNEEHLANEYGCTLGELETFIIQLDGNGTMFPMYESYEPGLPLWYIKCDWIDPTCDLFEDVIGIHINTAHKNYKYIDKTKNTYNEQLLKEVMSGAITLMISKLREDRVFWEVTTKGENLEPGSVSQAIYYFINTLEWDLSTQDTMSISIRKFLDQRM